MVLCKKEKSIPLRTNFLYRCSFSHLFLPPLPDILSPSLPLSLPISPPPHPISFYIYYLPSPLHSLLFSCIGIEFLLFHSIGNSPFDFHREWFQFYSYLVFLSLFSFRISFFFFLFFTYFRMSKVPCIILFPFSSHSLCLLFCLMLWESCLNGRLVSHFVYNYVDTLQQFYKKLTMPNFP